jgi:hypothetical protein
MEAALQTYLIPILLGLGLAASTGLRTFLPLLMLAGAARFDLFGIELNQAMGWLESDAALWALGAATAIEFVGDKVPAIDHFLNAVGFVTRPLAAIVATYAVFGGMDPVIGAVAAVVVGAPAALTFNAAQGGTRLASTATTGGLGNPVVSVFEDVLAVVTVLIAFVFPLLIPVVLALLLWLVISLARKMGRRFSPSRSPGTSA